jgi:membrane protein
MWSTLKLAVANWFRHRSTRLGAALAYYSVFSLGPLLLIVTSVAGLFLGADDVRSALSGQFRTLLGESGSQAIEAMLKGAGSAQSGRVTAIAGVVLFIVAALGVVVQLKDALNTIWEAKEPDEAGLLWYVKTYVASAAGVLALGFLLAVSLVVSTVLAALSTWLGVSSDTAMVWEVVNFIASLAVLTLLFAMLFKWFPDTDVKWTHVWPGAFATAFLFSIGKMVIAWYIGSQGLESTYGAAASLVVLLVWVYYSAQIVLFGAELTYAWSLTSARKKDATAAATSAATSHG